MTSKDDPCSQAPPITRRRALQTLGALALAAAAAKTKPAHGVKPLAVDPETLNIVKHLKTLSALEAPAFAPMPVVEAVNMLQPLGLAKGTWTLRHFIDLTEKAGQEVPGALFAVMRLLFMVPPSSLPAPKTPYDLRTAARPGYLRPPALGGPSPMPATDPALIPHFPILLMGDLPLSVVSGYILGGHPEPPHMHLDALEADCAWRKTLLAPKTPGEVRYLLVHWGGLTAEQLPLAFEQLDRLEKPAP